MALLWSAAERHLTMTENNSNVEDWASEEVGHVAPAAAVASSGEEAGHQIGDVNNLDRFNRHRHHHSYYQVQSNPVNHNFRYHRGTHSGQFCQQNRFWNTDSMTTTATTPSPASFAAASMDIGGHLMPLEGEEYGSTDSPSPLKPFFLLGRSGLASSQEKDDESTDDGSTSLNLTGRALQQQNVDETAASSDPFCLGLDNEEEPPPVGSPEQIASQMLHAATWHHDPMLSQQHDSERHCHPTYRFSNDMLPTFNGQQVYPSPVQSTKRLGKYTDTKASDQHQESASEFRAQDDSKRNADASPPKNCRSAWQRSQKVALPTATATYHDDTAKRGEQEPRAPNHHKQSQGEPTDEQQQGVAHLNRIEEALLGGNKTPRARDAVQTWIQRYKELEDFRKLYGHCNVPQKYPAGPKLGIWVNKQRMEKKFLEEGGRSSMTLKKIALLEDMGFQWAKRKGQKSWDEKFKLLCEYRAANHHCNVPTKYVQNPALGRWVSTQRSQYKMFIQGHKETQMNSERCKKLQAIGFKWSMMEKSL